ncbi:hypothetical protein HDU96_009396 [Phlyctochytrium bullatum]|nr:hypothetical protein HDU96_009396 [Phlyctochytrium bullatum]
MEPSEVFGQLLPHLSSTTTGTTSAFNEFATFTSPSSLHLARLTVTCVWCGAQWSQPQTGSGSSEGICYACWDRLLGRPLETTTTLPSPSPPSLPTPLVSFLESLAAPRIDVLRIQNLRGSPMYKPPLADAEEGVAWIDKAVIEKFYRSGVFIPFEVVRRQTFLQDFETASPMLRNAMCALAAMMSVPRAPLSVMRHYYEESRRLLLDNLDEVSIETWQTTLVLSMFSMCRLGPAFMLVGMAARLTSLFQVDQENNDDGVFMSMTELEQEICRRCYWTTFSMDRLIAIFTGRPVQVQSFNLDLEHAPSKPDTQLLSALPEAVATAGSILPPTAQGVFPLAQPSWSDKAPSPVPRMNAGGVGELHQSRIHPNIIFASRILAILYEISKAYDETEESDGNQPKALRWRREMMFERRIEEWEEQLPPRFKLRRVLQADDPLNVATLLIEDLMDDEPTTLPGTMETQTDFATSWDKGAGVLTVIRMIMFVTSRCCLLQLHRSRLHARRIFSREERQKCTATRTHQHFEKAFDPLSLFDTPTSRGLNRSLKIGCDVSTTVLVVFKAVVSISVPANNQTPRAAQLRRDLREFQPQRGAPVSGLATTLASICLMECCVAVGWMLVLEAVEGRPGRKFCGRDWDRWRGLWAQSDLLRDPMERARLLQMAVEGLSMALWLMEDLTLVRRVKPEASEGGRAASPHVHNTPRFDAASSSGRHGGLSAETRDDNPASSIFRVDERWADAMKEIIIRYESQDVQGWELRTDKEVEAEIAFLEKMEAMLEEQGVLGRIPFNGVMESLF